MSIEKKNDITLILTYDSQKVKTLKCDKNDKLEDIFRNVASQIQENLDSLIFIYSGKELVDFTKTFNEIINAIDDTEKVMNILIYNIKRSLVVDKKKNINFIFLLNSKDISEIKAPRETILKNIFNEYATKKLLKMNALLFKYGDKEIDLNKKFDDVATSYDKKCNGMSILVYNKNPLKIKFFYDNKNPYEMHCYKEDKIKDVFNNYALNNSLNINDLCFEYEMIPILIDSQGTFLDLFNNEDNKSREFVNLTTITLSNNINEIDIIVKQGNLESQSYFKKYKYIIIISIIIILILIISLISYFVFRKKKYDSNEGLSSINVNLTDIITESDVVSEIISDIITDSDKVKETDSDIVSEIISDLITDSDKVKETDSDIVSEIISDLITESDIVSEIISDIITDSDKVKETDSDYIIPYCEEGYKLVNGKCKADYLIKATYLSVSPNEQVDLISSSSYISQMIIDGKIITPTEKYNFPEKGYHTIYYKFRKATYSTSSNIRFFRNKNRLITVSFSDFDDYFPDISFQEIFCQCTNLTSVDLSKIALNLNKNYNLRSMFEGCINLKYIIFNLNILNGQTSAYRMFYNCKSLTSIDLSRLNMSTISTFNEMFYNCISLKEINMKGLYLKSAQNINYMFYNCISLKSIDISNFKPNNLKEMKNVFENCISLSYINVNDLYTHNVINMDKLFYNCTSLKSINISIFNPQNVKSISNMFGYCSSLESIDISNFYVNSLVDINSMFTHCYSLTSIIFKNFDTSKVTNMSYLFSHCYSLTSIDLSNFNTEKVIYFESMFSHCYSLKSINILHFNTKSFNNIKYMFTGCYSLTSIDLSNFNRSSSYDYIFYNCPNLNYVNISSFSYHSNNNNMFNKNISSYGTLILDKNFYDKLIYYKNYIPSNWTIIFT